MCPWHMTDRGRRQAPISGCPAAGEAAGSTDEEVTAVTAGSPDSGKEPSTPPPAKDA